MVNTSLATPHELVMAFQSAMTNLTAMYTAQNSAIRAEADALNVLSSVGHDGKVFVSPEDIPEYIREQLAQSSVDANLKKVQSEQITSVALRQVKADEEFILKKYKGRKCSVASLSKSLKPVEAVWWDNRIGDYKIYPVKSGRAKGVIDDISFEKNMLVLKPAYFGRMVNPDRKYFIVSVINPVDLQPLVSIV